MTSLPLLRLPLARIASARIAAWRLPGRRRWLCVVLLCAGIAEWIQASFTFAGNHSLIWFHQDFPALYAAGKLVAVGAGDRLYDIAAIGAAEAAAAGGPVGGTGVLGFFNPPFFALALAPLSHFSLDAAFLVWTALGLALVALNAWMLWRIARPLRRSSRALLVLAFVTLYPLTYGLQVGQFSLLLMTSWAAAFLLLRSGHRAWAGAALGPLLIKPELLIPAALYLTWRREWAVFATLAPLTALAVALSLGVIGPTNALGYPAYVLGSTTWDGSGIATSGMFNWSGIVAMLWDPAETPLALVPVATLSVATFAAAAAAVRRDAARPSTCAPQWALLTVVTVLVDPHLYLQDTILLAVAAAALLPCVREDLRGRVAALLMVGWLLLAAGIFPNEHLHVNAFGIFLVVAAAALVRWLLMTQQRDHAVCARSPLAVATTGLVPVIERAAQR